MRKTVAILGIPVDDLDTGQAIERIEEFIASRRFHQVATANTDFIVKAHHDPELMSILRDADLVVPDGMPIVLASRWLGAGLRERVTGADLVPKLAEAAARKGYRLFMLGAREEVARQARRVLETTYPGLQIVGSVSPPVGHVLEMDHQALLDQIAEARPDVLLVAFGNPKQEKWIYMHRRRLDVPVCIGVGGTFDFIAGALPRAPRWLQNAGGEWLYRLCQEPRRLWRRYTGDLLHFGRLMAVELWAMRRRIGTAQPGILDVVADDCTLVSVVGPLGAEQLQQFQRMVDRALDASTNLVLDLSAATQLDSSALGTLLNLPKRAAYVGKEARVFGAQGQVKRALGVARADAGLRQYATLAEALAGCEDQRLDVDLASAGRQAVITLGGRANVEHAALLRERLAAAPGTADITVVDASGVTYIDCACLLVLKQFADARAAHGARVEFVLSDAVRTSLVRERMLPMFAVAHDQGAAAPQAMAAPGK